MQYLFKICLNLAEWIEDQRGNWRARQEEEKTILTFLSQGAVGGMIGYFLFIVYAAPYFGGYGPFCYVALPFILAFAAIWGAITGFSIWLPGALFKRRIGFAGRTLMASGAMSLLSAAVFYLGAEQPNDERWLIGFFCAVTLPIVLLTGSAIRPGRALVFGAGGRFRGRRYRHWFATPLGFLLRTASIFAMVEALLALAVWVTAQMSPRPEGPGLEGLSTIILAITYFGASTYFSLKTPRKRFLLRIVIALNVPAVFLMMSERQVGTADSTVLACLYLGFICLWSFYAGGCLSAPENVSRAARLANGTYTLKGRHDATVCGPTVNYYNLR